METTSTDNNTPRAQPVAPYRADRTSEKKNTPFTALDNGDLTELLHELRETQKALNRNTVAQERGTYEVEHVAQVVSDLQAEIDRQQRER